MRKKYFLYIAALLSVQAGILFWFGQPTICDCGYVKLWEGVVLSSGNSQHLSDWYTMSHIIHGLLFYALLHVLFPRMSVWTRLVIAVALEISWEVLENTPWVIQAYREQALAQGYVGDSIVNSVSDTVAMIFGFLVAYKVPVIAAVLIGIALELLAGFAIRDNLTLNIIGFIHTFDAIQAWQLAQ